MPLSKDECQKYSRQIILPGFGTAAQQKLKNAKVLVIGCGGLGSPVLLYLAAAGVGQIGIVEFDTINITNLHRQILFDSHHVGKNKITEASEKLRAINPEIKLELFPDRLNSQNCLTIFKKYDLVVDCSDNFPTRYLVNDACEILNLPFIYAAIHQFEGQVAVFNYKNSTTYRDLFPTPPPPEMAPNCAESGILGSVAGIIGSLQANEALKIITGLGTPLVNQVLLVEVLEMQVRKLKISPTKDRKKIIELIDYEAFCSSKSPFNFSISKEEYKNWILENKAFKLIDVRSETEHEIYNIGGENITLEDIENEPELLNEKETLLFYCATGKRSGKIVSILRTKHGFDNAFSLNANVNDI